MKATNLIVHWSATDFGNASFITKLHLKNGWGETYCPGYHNIILNGYITNDTKYTRYWDGCVETGQPFDEDIEINWDEMGAHTLGYNEYSIGICLIGSPNRQPSNIQLYNLKNIIKYYLSFNKDLIILPHSAVNATECPGDKVREFLIKEKYWNG